MYSNRQYDKNPNLTQRQNNLNLIDLQSTISLNWKTFSDFIHNQIKNSSDNESKKKINELLNQCKSLIDGHINIHNEISDLRDNLTKDKLYEKNYNKNLLKEYDGLKKIYANLQNDLSKKKATLNNYEKILEKMRAKALYKNAKNELLILEPSKKNVSMHNEYLEIIEGISSKEISNENNAKTLEKLREELYDLQKKVSRKQYNHYNNKSND
jgi:hypothetical protein